ncbi:MAG: hydrolase [Chloroflexota bacterium]
MKTLLTPENCVMTLIDHQPQMIFGVESADRQSLMNNTVLVAKAAKVFNVPMVLSTIAAESLAGPIWPEIQDVFPEQTPIDRTTMNAWEDDAFRAAIEQTGRKKLVIAGLWTEVCVAFPALSAMEDGFEVYAIIDASAGMSNEAHSVSLQRMVQAGVRPVTSMQVMLELQRDWARVATYNPVVDVITTNGGAYGVGLRYGKWALGEHADETKATNR